MNGHLKGYWYVTFIFVFFTNYTKIYFDCFPLWLCYIKRRVATPISFRINFSLIKKNNQWTLKALFSQFFLFHVQLIYFLSYPFYFICHEMKSRQSIFDCYLVCPKLKLGQLALYSHIPLMHPFNINITGWIVDSFYYRLNLCYTPNYFHEISYLISFALILTSACFTLLIILLRKSK